MRILIHFLYTCLFQFFDVLYIKRNKITNGILSWILTRIMHRPKCTLHRSLDRASEREQTWMNSLFWNGSAIVPLNILPYWIYFIVKYFIESAMAHAVCFRSALGYCLHKVAVLSFGEIRANEAGRTPSPCVVTLLYFETSSRRYMAKIYHSRWTVSDYYSARSVDFF